MVVAALVSGKLAVAAAGGSVTVTVTVAAHSVGVVAGASVTVTVTVAAHSVVVAAATSSATLFPIPISAFPTACEPYQEEYRTSQETATYCKNFRLSHVWDEQVKSEDAALCVVLVIASVSLSGWAANMTRREGTGLDCIQRITTNGLDLFRELDRDGLVCGGSSIRCGVLVLLKSGNLRVLGLDRRTKDRLLANGSSVPFEGTEDEGVDHTVNISDRFGIRERLVGDGLLQAVGINDIAPSVVRLGVSDQTENGVDNLVRVIEVQGLSYDSESGFVRVFCDHSSVTHRRGGEPESRYKPRGTSRFHGSGAAKTEETRRRVERVNMMNRKARDAELKKGRKEKACCYRIFKIRYFSTRGVRRTMSKNQSWKEGERIEDAGPEPSRVT